MHGDNVDIYTLNLNTMHSQIILYFSQEHFHLRRLQTQITSYVFSMPQTKHDALTSTV